MRRHVYIIVAVLIIFSFLFGWEAAANQLNKPLPTPAKKISEITGQKIINLNLFWDVWERVNEFYVDASVAADVDQRVYGAIKGMVEALNDPYTVFMTPEETVQFQQSLNGTLEGIGAELTVKDQTLTIVSPLKNSPAERAGLKPDDVIYKINDEFTGDMTLFEAVSRIRGPKGTSVTLTVIRGKGGEPFTVTIKREKIQIDSVTLEEKKDGIFVIAINQFSDDTEKEFNAKVSELILKEPKGIILDLRFNGGGYLDIAVDVVSEFLENKKPVVIIERRDSAENETLFVEPSKAGRLKDIPLAVVVNKGSASASEIVAGAVQDNKRGAVIGEKTFGKGNVQEVQMLPDGSSLRITIANWLTPKGRTIQGQGITPDIEAVMTDEDAKKGRDPQLEKAMQYLGVVAGRSEP